MMITRDLEEREREFVCVVLTLSSNRSHGLVFFCRGGSLLNFNLLYSVSHKNQTCMKEVIQLVLIDRKMQQQTKNKPKINQKIEGFKCLL